MQKVQLYHFKYFFVYNQFSCCCLVPFVPFLQFSVPPPQSWFRVRHLRQLSWRGGGLRRKLVHGQLKAWQKLSDNSEFVTFQTGILPPPLVYNPFPNGTCEKTVSWRTQRTCKWHDFLNWLLSQIPFEYKRLWNNIVKHRQGSKNKNFTNQ